METFSSSKTAQVFRDGGHLDSAEDTIPGHEGSPRFTVPICGKISFYEKYGTRVEGRP